MSVICYPSIELREEWLYRLRQRWMDTQLPKDKAALDFAEASYSSSIKALDKDTDYDHLILTKMNYNLNDILIGYFNYKYSMVAHLESTANEFILDISDAGAILIKKGMNKNGSN